MVNVEARSLDAKVVTRRCVLAKLKELTIEKYRDIVSQSAGGILVLLPNNLAALPQEEQEVRSYWGYFSFLTKVDSRQVTNVTMFFKFSLGPVSILMQHSGMFFKFSPDLVLFVM